MSQIDLTDLGDLSMLELFRMEVEVQSTVLTECLLGLEQDIDNAPRLQELMRAAHSLKGAARIVGRNSAARIAHAMEDCFVAVQNKQTIPSAQFIDTLLPAVDFLNRIAQVPDETLGVWETAQEAAISACVASLSAVAGMTAILRRDFSLEPQDEPAEQPDKTPAATPAAPVDRALRVTAANLNSLMGLAGEALMTSRWLEGFAGDLLRLKQSQRQLGQSIESLRNSLPAAALNEQTSGTLKELQQRATGCQESLAERISAMDLFEHRFLSFSTRLYHEVLDCRMRPFADGIQGFRRMTREVAQSLGKKVQLEISGDATHVDREILERLKVPLAHLLRNAIDHGIEGPGDRTRLGKPECGTVQLQACHSAGMLLVTVADDGSGIDLEAVRRAAVRRNLTTLEMAGKMTSAEVLEFLFLPGFTMKDSVSEISGRGVGLDIVQTMVKEVGGRVRISPQTGGSGIRFQLELPLTLSLVRTLLVEIGGEPYAFPLARVESALKLPRERIESAQGRQHFTMGEVQVGLVPAHQVLAVGQSPPLDGDVSVVVLSDKTDRYGLVIDRFLGERELVVRTLDSRLGKVRNISSAALLPDGSPVLIVDIDDLKRSIENLVSGDRLALIGSETGAETTRKHVLVVDDSLTVRELERKLLVGCGYIADVAIDGMDGWNAVRAGNYDLVVTDIDMPRMNGIELLKLIRRDHRLKSLPVMIVSYKDRPEDRTMGMEAGADYYLTKASFHDETLLRVVKDLIGPALT